MVCPGLSTGGCWAHSAQQFGRPHPLPTTELASSQLNFSISMLLSFAFWGWSHNKPSPPGLRVLSHHARVVKRWIIYVARQTLGVDIWSGPWDECQGGAQASSAPPWICRWVLYQGASTDVTGFMNVLFQVQLIGITDHVVRESLFNDVEKMATKEEVLGDMRDWAG